MSYTLKNFHFNPQKLAQILKQLFKEHNASNSYVSRSTDISRDIIDNLTSGKNQDIKFEQLFKICCLFEIPLSVIEMLMIKDEDIDFADKIVYYDVAKGDILPAADVEEAPLPVSDTVVAVAEAVAATDKPPQPAQPTKSAEDHIAFLQAHIERLAALLELAMRKE